MGEDAAIPVRASTVLDRGVRKNRLSETALGPEAELERRARSGRTLPARADRVKRKVRLRDAVALGVGRCYRPGLLVLAPALRACRAGVGL